MDRMRLNDSYRNVQQISRRSKSNFYRSFWLLPHEKRRAMCALYAFARVTDDIGDCQAPASSRRQWLHWWKQATETNLMNRSLDDSILLPSAPIELLASCPIPLQDRARQVLPALRDSAHRFDIPARYLLEIIDGVIADQNKTRFDTFEQLEHYCYLVASAVGLACLHIWQFASPLPTRAAIDCGLAFQLTNILRDIREDAARGRIYLPQQHWAEHGLCEDDLLAPRPDDRLRCLIIDEAKRASSLYRSGWNVWNALHPDGQRMFSMMWRTYRRLLHVIESDPGAVLVKRITLSRKDRFGIVAQHYIRPMFRRLQVPPVEAIS